MPAFRRDPRATVVALCGSDPAKTRTIADRLGVPRVHATWRALVADPEIDVVSIAVPPVIQCEIAGAAVAHGKHVFVEKPVGIAARPVAGFVDAAERARRCAMVDFLFSRVPAFEDARRAIAAGSLGTITDVAVTWRTKTYAHRMGTDSWKRHAGDGGGALGAFGSHTLHTVEWLAGPIARLQASLSPDAERDERVDATFELAGGGHGAIRIDTNSDEPTLHRIELRGTLGARVLESHGPGTVAGFGPVASTDRGADDRIEPAARLASELLDAIERDTPGSTNLRDGLRVQVLIDATRESHRTGRPVPTLP